MKYLVLLLIVLAVVGWLRLQRRASSSRAAPSPQDMLPCAHCGVHLPRGEAVTGDKGMYCCADHLRQHES